MTSAAELANVPIIDLRGSHNFNDIHTDYHSYVMRARLDAANGGHGNQVIWTWDGSIFGIGPPPSVALKSFLTMDSWLSTIESDTRNVPLAQKVLDDKPSGAADECFIGAVADGDDGRGGVRGGVPVLRRRAARRRRADDRQRDAVHARSRSTAPRIR